MPLFLISVSSHFVTIPPIPPFPKKKTKIRLFYRSTDLQLLHTYGCCQIKTLICVTKENIRSFLCTERRLRPWTVSSSDHAMIIFIAA